MQNLDSAYAHVIIMQLQNMQSYNFLTGRYLDATFNFNFRTVYYLDAALNF